MGTNLQRDWDAAIPTLSAREFFVSHVVAMIRDLGHVPRTPKACFSYDIWYPLHGIH